MDEASDAKTKQKMDSDWLAILGGFCFFGIAAGGGRILDNQQQAYLAVAGALLISINVWWDGRTCKSRPTWRDYRFLILAMSVTGLVIGTIYRWLLAWVLSVI